ncbi:MAG: hypothetical protein HUJ61_01650, partial [Bacilli bacterium]|nr:hypothetical protein [Bacilli bacterium]
MSFTVKCYFVDNFTLYNIKDLGKNPLKDKDKFYTTILDNNTIYYNFCDDIQKEMGCNSSSSQVKAEVDGQCISLTRKIGTGNQWSVSNNTIQIVLNQIDDSNDVVKYILECDENTTNTKKTEPIENKSYFRKVVDNKTETVLYFKT